jgi:chromosome segregation ATPase
MPSTSGKQRTKEDVVKEIAKLDEAQTRIGSRIEEIATQIATGTKEQREEREKSLRKGYPAKASQSQRELRLEQQDLQDQLGDLARMRARLQLEEVGLDLAAVVKLRDQYVAEVNELEGPHRELTEKLEAARARAQNTRSHESGLREARSRAEATLYQLDSDYREKIEREIDERRRREEEGMKRQREERTREFAAAVDESNKEQGIGIPIASAPAPADDPL